MMTASLCGPTCGGQFFVHVIGALALFGSVLAVTILSYAVLRIAPEMAQLLRRVVFWTTLVFTVPAWIVMYGGGYWLLGHEGLDNDTPGWADGGIQMAHVAALFTLLLLVFGWLSTRQRRRRIDWVVAALATIYLVVLAVAWFFMSYKPDL
jgi:hypothetical protein